MAETRLIVDEAELDKTFNVTEESLSKGKGRKPKLNLPGDGETIRVRLCHTKIGDKLGFVYQVQNDKFTNDSKTGNFITVETLDNPEFEREMNCPSSLFNSFRKISNEEGISINEMPGKVVLISGAFWTSAPTIKRNRKRKCTCGGKGCKLCIITGVGKDAGKVSGLIHPIVFNAQFDKEFMSSETSSNSQIDEDDY